MKSRRIKRGATFREWVEELVLHDTLEQNEVKESKVLTMMGNDSAEWEWCKWLVKARIIENDVETK
jgi:hypothetical protein